MQKLFAYSETQWIPVWVTSASYLVSTIHIIITPTVYFPVRLSTVNA